MPVMPTTGEVLKSETEFWLVESQPVSAQITDATRRQRKQARSIFTNSTLDLAKLFVQKKFRARGFNFLWQSGLLHSPQ